MTRRTTPAATRLVVAAAVAAAGTLAGCDGGADRQSYVERAVALAPEIERATGLRFKSPPRVEVRSRDQVRAFLERELEDSATKRTVAAMAAAYKRLGLVHDTVDLAALYRRVYEEQIVG